MNSIQKSHCLGVNYMILSSSLDCLMHWLVLELLQVARLFHYRKCSSILERMKFYIIVKAKRPKIIGNLLWTQAFYSDLFRKYSLYIILILMALRCEMNHCSCRIWQASLPILIALYLSSRFDTWHRPHELLWIMRFYTRL